MGARIIPFLEKVTETFSYLVIDPLTHAALIIDPLLDYDPAAGRIRTHSADAIAKAIHAEGLRVEWILETHVHADHLSAAGYLKKKLGGVLGIGSNVRQVQQILGELCAPANCRRLSRTPPLFQDPDRGFNTLILSDPLPIIWVFLAGRRSRARSPS
jgi:glyoxylase-like metal-dependent hydrolase (beta-lactamase superfamily II)